MTMMASRSSTTARVSRKARRALGRLRPTMASTETANAMSVAVGAASPRAKPSAAVRFTARYRSAGTTMPPTAATIGTTAVLGFRSSPATISRLSSRPTTKKKIASRPSVAHVATVRSRCRAAGPRTVSDTWVYDAGSRFAHSSAATVAASSSAPPTRSSRRVSSRLRSDPGDSAANRRLTGVGTGTSEAGERTRRPDFPAHRGPGYPGSGVGGLGDLVAPVDRAAAVLGRVEAVADVAHGADELLVLGAELGAQASHVDVDRPGASVVVVAPDLLQQLRAREHAARVLDEVLQEL